MWLDKLGRTSWTVKAEFILNGESAALATQAGVFVNYRTLRPVPVPDALRVQFEKD